MTTPAHTLGRIEFVPYDKYPPGTSPAPSAIELARLYDRAAQRIAVLERALRYIARLDTSQDASPAQCSAVLVAMDALHSSDPDPSEISHLQS